MELSRNVKFQCKHCKNRVSFKDVVPQKKRSSISADAVQSTICETVLESIDALKKHVQYHKKQESHRCPFCSKSTNQSEGLLPHTKSHTVENSKESERNENIFRLTVNNNNTEPDVPHDYHICKVCGGGFSSRETFRVHLSARNHGGVRRHPSDITNSTAHKETQVDIKRCICPECKQSFSELKHLKSHVKQHMEKKRFQCKFCDKSYSRSDSLKDHIKKHKGQTQYTCAVCNEVFVNRCQLRVHRRKHTGEKPHKCRLCKQSFIQRSDLSRHMRIHSGEKQYKCRECGKGFILKCNLTTHMLSHNHENHYHCPHCEKSFSFPGNLKRDINGIHFRSV